MIVFRFLFLLTSLCFISNNINSQEIKKDKIRIGTFDSRCVALAYGRTDFLKEIRQLKTELTKAKEEGDSVRIKELETLGPTKQVLMHQQGFSTGSITNIIDKIKDKIPAIANNNNVSMIVSKWEVVFINELFEKVDLTDMIVSLFNPDEKTLQIIEKVKSMEPVPLEEISVNPMH